MSKANRATKLQIKSPLELAVRGLVRHWLYLLLAVLIAAGVGLLAVKTFGKKRYTCQGKIFYSPNRVTEPYYVSPSLRDLQLAIIEPSFLRTLQEKYSPDEDFIVFAYLLNFELNGASSIDVSFTGRDPDATQTLVQGSMRAFIESAKELRRSALDGYVKDFGQDIVDAEKRHRKALSDLEQEIGPIGFLSDEALTAEITRLRQSISGYETDLANAQARRDLSDAQVEFLAQLNEPPRSESDQTNTDPESRQGDEIQRGRKQSLATFDSQMQKLLEDRIRRERDDGSLQLQIDLKQKEFERSQSSFERDLISEAAFEKVRGELQLLESQRSNRIQELETRLSEINGRINDRTESLAVLDPLTAATLFSGSAAGSLNTEAQTVALLKGSRTAAVKNIEQLNKSIEETRQRLSELSATRQSAVPLINNVESAAAQLDRLREIRDEFSRAEFSSQAELNIAQNATRLLEGERNNYMKWFLAAALATGGVLILPLLGLEFLKAWRQAPESGSVFGLPVLARKPSAKFFAKHPEDAEEAMQRLSLRIAQAYGRRDGVLSLAGGKSSDENDDVLKALADYYRRSGVNVSIADAADLVAGSETAAIAGSWISNAKQGRGLTLVRSPLMAGPLQGDSAAANSDATIIMTSRSISTSPSLQRRIAELSGLGTRVIGVVMDR